MNSRYPNISDELRARGFQPEPEAARTLGASPATLKSWRIRGCGPRYFKLAGRILYRQDDLDAFIAASARRSTREAADLTGVS